VFGSDAASAYVQALQALKRLHENISTERRALLELQRAWFAVIQPHQLIRGELAAWPGSVYPMRMIKYLGAFARRITPYRVQPLFLRGHELTQHAVPPRRSAAV